MRNLAERGFNKLKQFRAVAPRHEKYPGNHMAGVKFASARNGIRLSEPAA